MTEKIEQANKRELKRISKEKAEVVRDLRKLLIDKQIVSKLLVSYREGMVSYLRA